MPILTLDERRRITLPKDVVEGSEQQFVAIKTKDGILLKTLPKDPIATLQKIGEKIPKELSIADLKKIALEAAEEEALGNLKRLEKLGKNKKKGR